MALPSVGGGVAAVPPMREPECAQRASLVAPDPTWHAALPASLATPLPSGMLLMAEFVHGGKEEEEDIWV